MNYLEEIRAYKPPTPEEQMEKDAILDTIERYGDSILDRTTLLAHMTSSGFIMNPQLDKCLMAYHNIYDCWAWTGGHCDGDPNLLAVALREAQEETGATDIYPLTDRMLSLDMLTVENHYKRGKYVPSHIHINASYVLISEDTEHLRAKLDENSGVSWIPANDMDRISDEPDIIVVYKRLIRRARELKGLPPLDL